MHHVHEEKCSCGIMDAFSRELPQNRFRTCSLRCDLHLSMPQRKNTIQHGAGGAGAWDAHSGLKGNHESNFKAVDKPVAALLKDLKQRGLLDSTIVIFATEFGRTPASQGTDGRDHHPHGFSVWMAGGGIKGGIAHGATDEIRFHAVEHRHYVTDIHATILRQLGLDSRKLEVPGRKRLEIDHGNPIMEIIG